MNQNREIAFAFLFLAFFMACAEVIQWESCPYTDDNPTINCIVHEVRVNPCQEAAEHKPCKLKRGHAANISFNYTANFEGTELKSRAYWSSEVADLPFMGMSTNACSATPCPAVSGLTQIYNTSLNISKTFPVRTYKLKWKLWNEEEQECCFMFYIKLQK
ncbi:hypothetical protein KM043_018228 [Ampulex compressa]|nr:hypothetical protein KM043_018228 [Ampulex compressa]